MSFHVRHDHSSHVPQGQIARLRLRVQQFLKEHPHSVLQQIGQTPLVSLPTPTSHVQLYAKLESRNPTGSLKDRIVLYLIADALERGLLTEDTTLIEGTSGNTGISLAMVGAVLGYSVLVFMPENVSVERRHLIKAFGAEVRLTPAELGTDGAIEAARALGREPGYCWLAQHENLANIWAHYDTTGAEILCRCPQIDLFVAPSGTTGTLMGVSMRLKEAKPTVEVVAVWPEDSIMGLRRPVGAQRPKIYDERWIDRVIEVRASDAKAATREWARAQGWLLGPSSAAAWLAAQQLAQEYAAQGREAQIVVCFPDEGSRYLSTDTFVVRLDGAPKEEM